MSQISSIPPLLIGSCVYPSDTSVKLKNPESRIAHVIEGVSKWLDICKNIEIVICDGSGYNFYPEIKNKFPNSNIECLSFLNSEYEVSRLGKGYGEGEIIKFALTQSNVLSKSEVFIKSTGKLWVKNFYQCLDQFNSDAKIKFIAKGVFSDIFKLKKTKLLHIDTRFYIVNKDFYNNYFLDSYKKISEQPEKNLEEVFLDIALQIELKNFLFNVNPKIYGVGGGSGTYYRNNARRFMKDSVRIYFAKHLSEYKDLFI